MDDIELEDKTKTFIPFLINDNSINLNNITNSNYNNNNISIPNQFGLSPEINLFSKNKKSIYSINQQNNKPKNLFPGELISSCERRLQNDLSEFKTSKIDGKMYEVKLNDHKKIEKNSF